MPGPVHLNKLHPVNIYSDIIDEIRDWDTDAPLNGIGYFKKTEQFGHIEITISKTDYFTDTIKWSVPEGDIPQSGILDKIVNQIDFFSNFISAIKVNSTKSLVFEITNITYHATDSWRFAFSYATAHALKNCFDKDFTNLTQADKDLIVRFKEQTISQNKHKARSFSSEEIITSLKDIGLNDIVRTIVGGINIMMLEYNIEPRYMKLPVLTELFLRKVSLEVLSNLKTVNIISKYDELTDIGIAHIAVILKNRAAFISLNIKDLTALYGYYDIGFML